MRNYEQYKRMIRFLTSIAILIVEIGIYWFAWNRYFSQVAGTPFFRYLERGNVFYSQILSLILTSMFTYLQIALLAKHFLNIIPFLVMFVLQVIAVCIWIFLANFLFQKLFPPRQMLLIYGNRPSLTLMDKMNSRSDRYQIKNVIHIDAGLMKIEQMISSYDAIVICDVPSSIRNQLLKYCYGEGIRVYMTPKLSDILVRSAEDITLFDTPLIMARNGHISVEQAFFKRTMDIIIAGTACILASPFMLITAIAIKFQDGGREFYVYKFRSMTMDAEQDGIARLACVNDNRITPVGAFIRKIRLDETPQLCNILKGDMSIVGPRPERPEIARQYEEEMPEFRYRLRVKAGLTGYAQIFGKYNTTPYDKLKLDLHYIQNYSLMMDVKLMIQTLKILFMRESTKGIAENQTTARLLPDTNEKE